MYEVLSVKNVVVPKKCPRLELWAPLEIRRRMRWGVAGKYYSLRIFIRQTFKFHNKCYRRSDFLDKSHPRNQKLLGPLSITTLIISNKPKNIINQDGRVGTFCHFRILFSTTLSSLRGFVCFVLVSRRGGPPPYR